MNKKQTLSKHNCILANILLDISYLQFTLSTNIWKNVVKTIETLFLWFEVS